MRAQRGAFVQVLDKGVSPLPPRLLSAIAIERAASADFEIVDEPRPGERTSERVFFCAEYDVWLIRWGAGSRTILHDHGGSAGALHVVMGELVEQCPNPTGVGRPLRRLLRAFDYRPMSATHVHEIANATPRDAASVHVYSPPLLLMNHYEQARGSQIRRTRREVVEVGTLPANERTSDD
jgi:hypothetical protein